MIKLDSEPEQQIYMKIISVGYTANNMVNALTIKKMEGVKFISFNTNNQAINKSHTSYKDSFHTIRDEICKDVGVVLVIACMEEESDFESAAIISNIAKDAGNITIGVVIKQLNFKESKQIFNTEEVANDFKKSVDTLVILPNDKSLETINEKLNKIETYKKYDELLQQMIQELLLLITMPINPNVIINVKHSDLRTILENKGIAYMGTARASKIAEAVRIVTQSQLPDKTMHKANYVLINITTPKNLGLIEVSEPIGNLASSKQEFVYNVTINNDLNNEIAVSIIATGFEEVKNGDKIHELEIPEFLKRKR